MLFPKSTVAVIQLGLFREIHEDVRPVFVHQTKFCGALKNMSQIGNLP